MSCQSQTKGNLVTSKGEGGVGTCTFPFTYSGTTYNSCASPIDYGGVGWCAWDTTYLDGRWGYCSPDSGCTSTTSTTAAAAAAATPRPLTAIPGDVCTGSRDCTDTPCKNGRCCRSDIDLACMACDDAGFCDSYDKDLFSNPGTYIAGGVATSTDDEGADGFLPPSLATANRAAVVGNEPEPLEEEGGLEVHDIIGTVFGVTAVLIAAGVLAWKVRGSDNKRKELLIFFGCEDAEVEQKDFDQTFHDSIRTCDYKWRDSSGRQQCSAETQSKYCKHHSCSSPSCPQPTSNNETLCGDCKIMPAPKRIYTVPPPPPGRQIQGSSSI